MCSSICCSPNPNLKPEQSLQWELGIRGSFLSDDIGVSATYFNADLKDEINGFVYDPTTGGFTSSNIEDSSERSGVELEASYRFMEAWYLKGTYTYLDASQESSSSKVREVRRPMHSGVIVLQRTVRNAGASLVISYTGEQVDDFFPPYPPYQEKVDLKPFTTVDISGYLNISEKLSVNGRVGNILDKRYEQVYGYASPGIECHIGLRLHW